MPDSGGGGRDSTCWELIEAAAAGRRPEQEEFVRRYAPVVRAYLAARWRDHVLRSEIDDAAQEVFLECVKEGGALGKADPAHPGGFRPFLLGVVRHVAQRAERRLARRREVPAGSEMQDRDVPADDPGPATVFDRAWARSVLRAAADLQRRWAAGSPAAEREMEVLRLRFADGLPIRDIAAKWGDDPARVHRLYRDARQTFRRALAEIVAFHRPGATPAQVSEECAWLLDLVR